MRMRVIQCRRCGKQFVLEVSRSKLASGRAFYCSEACYEAELQNTEQVTCTNCGKPVVANSLTAPYCSVTCKALAQASAGRRGASGTNPYICQMVGCFEAVHEPVVLQTNDTLYLCAKHRAQLLAGQLTAGHIANMTVYYIHDLRARRLNRLYDERGSLCEILRRDDPLYADFPEGFAQVYITHVDYHVVKGWHLHLKQRDHFFCVYGTAKVVLYDDREDSLTRGLVNEMILTPERPLLLQIPERVWHGFMALSPGGAGILNFPTRMYDYADPDEYRCDPHSGQIPYSWEVEDR